MEEEYMLKWRDYQSNFFALAEELYLNEFLTDVTLCCKNQYFEAHRLVLSVCSPYFHSLFTQAFHSHPMKHPIIFLKDVKPVEMERLLQFIYYGEVKVPNSEIDDFIQAASSLNIRGLSSLQKPRRETEEPPPTSPPPPTHHHSTHGATPHLPSTSRMATPHLDNKSSPLKKRKRRHSHLQSLASPIPVEASLHHPTRHHSLPVSRPPSMEPKQERSLNLSTKRSPPRRSNDLLPEEPPCSIPTLPEALPPPAEEPESGLLKREDENHRSNNAENHEDEERGVSPPPSQFENVTILPDLQSTSANALYRAGRGATETPRILPPNEPRKSGTCYFCKKAFMKNKQLMNHVCPKKPKVTPLSSSSPNGGK